MTTPTRLLLIFTPTINPGEFADHQTVQAVFAAAKLTTLPEVNRVIGDPMIVLPQDLHKRASETKWRDFGEASILEHLGEAFRIDYRAEQRSDSEIDCESCNAWDEIRSTLAGILGTEEKRGTARMVREVAAEVERLRIDVRHHSEQTEAVKEHFARHRKAGVEAEQAASAELEAERAKVAELEVKLQHEHLIVLACNNELELSRGRVNDLVAQIATKAALAVLDVLTPAAPLAPHKVRVSMHGPDILRVLVATATEQAVLEEVEVEVADKIGDALGHDSLVVVQREPGEPAPGYIVRPASLVTSDDGAGLDHSWLWRHDSEAEGGADEFEVDDQAVAIDATWDQFAADAVEEEAEEDAEDETP